MFSIYSGTNVLHHPDAEDPDCVALEAKLSEELNTHGSFDGVFTNPHNLWIRSPLEVYDEDGLIWRGRVLSIENGLDTRKTVHGEGALSFLCDTIIRPFAFRGRPNDYTNNGATVKGLFHHFIDIHNSQLDNDDPRRFTVGDITVTDPNDYIYRSSESAMTTWEAIQTRLIDTLGGYIVLSGENLNVINYVSDFNHTSLQPIEFGENLVDLLQTDDSSDIVTHLYAYGAKIESGTGHENDPNPDDDEYITWNGSRLFTAVYLQAAINKWGDITGTHTWDDITVQANLETAADKYLADIYAAHVEALDVKAADLSLIDVSVDKINVGDYVQVRCDPLGLDLTMLCMRKETDLIDVSQTRVSIGRVPATISSMAGGSSK